MSVEDREGRVIGRFPVEEKPKFVATNHARVLCIACAEWIYTQRRAGGGPAFFPPRCPVCGAETELEDLRA